MVEDYEKQKYDIVQLHQGRWPGKDDIGVERLSSQYFKVGLGDSVTFKLGKTERALPISGLIRHPFVPPPDFGGQAYFFVNGEGLERFGVPTSRYGAMMLRVKPYSLDHAKQVANTIKDHLARQGIGVGQAFFQDPDKHWGRPIVEGITAVLQVLAVIALITSVVLVLNTVTALITQQTNQIGVLKAIGGTSGVILRVYLVGVLAYGVLALLVGVPAGLLVASGMSASFLNVFNIDITAFQFSPLALTFSIVSAIGVPLLAALWPVFSGATITVRAAIASYGLGGDFGSSWIDRAVERVGGKLLPAHYATALGNMFRRKARFVLTQLVLIMAGVMFLVVMSLASSMTATLDAEFGRRAYDATLYFQSLQRIDRIIGMAQAAEGVDKAVMSVGYPATIYKAGQRTKEAGWAATLSGYPIEANFFRPLITAGRWLQPGQDREIVLNQDTAKRNTIQVGDTVTLDLAELGKGDWQVVGLYKLVFGGGFGGDEIFCSQDALFDATKRYNLASQLHLRMQRGATVDAKTAVTRLAQQFEEEDMSIDYVAKTNEVTTLLKTLFEGRGMKIAYALTMKENFQQAEGQFSIFVGMLLALAVIVAAVGGVGLMGALSISVVERTKEIGVLRAVGARSGTITGMFVMEGVLQGVFSWIIAVPISLALSSYMAKTLGLVMFSASLDYRYNYSAVFIWLAVVLVISILASILPARNATRISVRESLAYA
jgi:putative ABC transport system permease protein